MKKYIVSLVLFFVCLSSYAQSYREVRIYVPPIDGIGVIDDMAYFYKQISYEITAQYRTLGRTRSTADYVMTGKLMPLSEVTDVALPPSAQNDENILFVELYDNIVDEVVGTQYITYSGWPDEFTDESLSVIIYNMLAGIPDLIESQLGGDSWRNKWLYLNLSFLWTPRVYIGDKQSANVGSVGGEVMLDFHFLSFIGLKASAQITQEWIVVGSGSNKEEYKDMVLELPVAVSFIVRPAEILMLEPYLGASLNLSLFGGTKPFIVSWLTGITIGIKAGIGIVTFDPRFAMDFQPSSVTSKSGNKYNYWRYLIHVGVGYKIGFFNKR